MSREREEIELGALITWNNLRPRAKEVLGQLFLSGPLWDGHVASKAGRDDLHASGLIERGNGWQWLTREGVDVATCEGPKSPDNWFGGRWRKKAIA